MKGLVSMVLVESSIFQEELPMGIGLQGQNKLCGWAWACTANMTDLNFKDMGLKSLKDFLGRYSSFISSPMGKLPATSYGLLTELC